MHKHCFKGIVHLKLKMVSFSSLLHSILHDLISSVEHKRRYFEMGSSVVLDPIVFILWTKTVLKSIMCFTVVEKAYRFRTE